MIKDITNKKFNRLLILRMSLRRGYSGQVYWKCKCNCGNIVTIRGSELRNNHTKSCGCLSIEKATKHGFKGTRFWNCWQSLKQRCNGNCDINHYKNYKCRGITYDKGWNKFENFLKDMYFKWVYAKKKYGEWCLSIERMNNDGNYCFENCIFIPMSEQYKNKRKRNEH